MADIPELMTVAEVAAVLRVSDETIHRWCRQDRLKPVNTPGPKRFNAAYIKEMATQPREKTSRRRRPSKAVAA